MKTKRLKKYSLFNLIAGYLIGAFFIVFTLLNVKKEGDIQLGDDSLANTRAVVTELNQDKEDHIIYTTPTSTPQITIIPSHSLVDAGAENAPQVYHDRLINEKINNERIFHTDRDTITMVDTHSRDLFTRDDGAYSVDRTLFSDGFTTKPKSARHNYRNDEDVDFGLLDRRLTELDTIDAYGKPRVKHNQKDKEKVGLHTEDGGVDFSRLSPSDGDDLELGDPNSFTDNSLNSTKEYGIGKSGQLYAYNFPTRGVGAGIGSSALGAGAGGGAGLGAGIGEGVLNGEVVPTLGGVGDGAKTLYGEPAQAAGVGGLVGGAGAGGAAGLTQGYVTEKLGLGIGKGVGGTGGSGNGRSYDHLPKDGALHIMMHVDGSGSILNTRKQLEIMKDSILKEALLPYYNNDLSLYDRRVTIISNSGERTLRFFTEAAQKNNVLAVAFQDEAQPAYHLPNFNRKPEDHYLTDLGALKGKLGNHKGIYRGVLFQVDRGRTFAKSFKEFLGNAFQGTGYLSEDNLKKYHRDNNRAHIKNKNGVVFSDEYHAKDEGSPQYYLDLLFNAARKVGLDLNFNQGGLTDGQYIKTN